MKDIDHDDAPPPMIRQEQQFQPAIIATWAGVFAMLRQRCPDNVNLMRIAEAAQQAGDLSQIAAHGSAEDLKAAHDRVMEIASGMLPPVTGSVEDGTLHVVSNVPLPTNNADAMRAYGHLSTEDLVAKVREFDERSRAGEPVPQIAREPQAESEGEK